jgi:hypothetical protein
MGLTSTAEEHRLLVARNLQKLWLPTLEDSERAAQGRNLYVGAQFGCKLVVPARFEV